VSDAGGKMSPDADPKLDWPRHTRRVLDVVDNQVRSLRKRQLISSYVRGERKGAYWGIRSHIEDYDLRDRLNCPGSETLDIASIPTRLKRMSDYDQERLINWGYAICDTAIRKHVNPNIRAPNNFPFPKVGVG
jgi:NTE family protein